MQKIALSLIFIFFVGCSVKTTPVYSVIKTPKIKLSDQGFIKEGLGYKEIIIYKSGVSPFKITIKNSFICLNNKCMDKEKFVKEYLSSDYPEDILDLIISKRPIKNFGKITFTKKGFVQKNERFFYKVEQNRVFFRDKKRNIIVMIKYLEERG